MSARPGLAQRSHKKPVEPSDPFWRGQANCREDVDPDMFTDPNRYQEALQVCVGCPVTAQCSAERRGASGVWGGRVFAQRNNHLAVSGFMLAPHGTEAAKARHRRAREEFCDICKGATR